MDSVPIFVIGIGLTALMGLPDRYIERLIGSVPKSIFYLLTGFLGIVLIIADIPSFLIANKLPLYWFFVPFVVIAGIWATKWCVERNDVSGKWKDFYYAYFMAACTAFIIFAINFAITIWS